MLFEIELNIVLFYKLVLKKHAMLYCYFSFHSSPVT